MIVELDLVSPDSISQRSPRLREVGDPDVVIYNAGYLEGRELPPEKELLEHIPLDCSKPRNTLPAVARSWSRKRCCPPCASVEPGRSSFRITRRPCAAEAADRPVAVLSAGDDAHAGAGADGGIFRAWHSRG